MRIDKFMKIALLFKTRSSAEKAIEKGDVLINETPAKPASNIKVGDRIKIHFPLKTVTYEVNELHEKSVSRAIAREMTTMIEEEKHDI